MNKNKKTKKHSGGLFNFLLGNRNKQADAMSVEQIISPSKQVFLNFMHRPLAVIASLIVICMFVLVFVAPLFVPLDLNYTDSLQASIEPGFKMMAVPSELANDVKTISSYSNFSVGLSNAGKVYVWGSTRLGTTGVDMKNIPEEVQNSNILFAAAGYDHAIAIDDQGNVYGWGSNLLGQYPGSNYVDASANVNEILPDAKVDINNVKDLKCGYQSTAILMKDGTVLTWGNSNACLNMKALNSADSLVDITYTGSYLVGLKESGTITVGNVKGMYDTVNGNPKLKLGKYLDGRDIEDISSTTGTIAMMVVDTKADAAATNDTEKAAAREVIFSGNFAYGEKNLPQLAADEYFVQVEGGANHYTGLTNKGHVYSWGANQLKQCNVTSGMDGVEKLIVTSYQNYGVTGNKVVEKFGHKGYLFGTDTHGADVFARCVHGGKMTMTIGAVAVIVSTIIAIVVGCVSGYAGGWVDLLLMRVAEIFGAIPFLPFAMILSSLLLRTQLSETQKLMLIMVILGVLSWTGLANLVRAQILAEREKEFVTAAKAMGVSEARIAFKHILPNVISVILVNISLNFAGCMLTESSLSYLGFGVQYPRPTWGNMLNGANNSIIIKNYWWQWLFPALLLAICTICINIIGDNIRDVMDPKSDKDK